ncbi:zinc ribbon domain-containing protein [Cellulomonas fimi]|uniref:Coagulation factor 5/8 type domain protein n=2 Tax=Cellulomonas fimi TaxID=1708 RepID=F4H5I0_CELFA|nr:zinc ribbon domain-containing protein [Cellulomonas fimi]AEE44304.1 coagulation factor 5/8 type domain protein [Cellulomonas fimi ATCC 484]VEH26084.1 putative protein serine/threonine phosphatase [Cellulomonas fimi]
MIVCPSCGTRNEDDEQFCGGCGSYLWDEPEVVDVPAATHADPADATASDTAAAAGPGAHGTDATTTAVLPRPEPAPPVLPDPVTPTGAQDAARPTAGPPPAASTAPPATGGASATSASNAAPPAAVPPTGSTSPAVASTAGQRVAPAGPDVTTPGPATRTARDAGEAGTAQRSDDAPAAPAAGPGTEQDADGPDRTRREREAVERESAQRAEREAAERAAARTAAAAALVAPPPPARPTAPAASTQPAPVRPGATQTPRPPRRPAPADEQPPSPGDLVCGSCGAGNTPTRKFCRRCGASLADAPVAQRRSWWSRLWRPDPRRARSAGFRPPRRRRFPTRPVVALLVVGALVAAVLAFRPEIEKARIAVVDRIQGNAAVNPVQVVASSELPERPAAQIRDGATNLAWSPAAPGDGVGQFVDFTFGEPFRLTRVLVTPGASDVETDFLANASPEVLTLTATTSAGTQQTVEVPLADRVGLQDVATGIDDVVAIRLTISSTYRATPTTHVAVAEVEFRGR